MRAFVRVVCLVNAIVWAYLVVKGSALPPDQFRWAGLVLFAASLIGAAVSGGSKQAGRNHSDPFRSSVAQPRPTSLPLPAQGVPPTHDISKYRAVLAEGKKIQAIKLLREDFPHLGLKGAKDIIESLE